MSEWPVFKKTPSSSPTTQQSVQHTAPAPRPYGPFIQCTVFEGQAQFPSGWFPLQNTNFKIRRGDNDSFTLRSKKNETREIYVRFDDAGQKMVFCPETDEAGRNGKIACYSIYALEDDFDAGIKRTFDVPKAVRGSEMTCKTISK
ncbi:MAG: hypothetical protein EP349_06400 [Alphaproteobacteria bacterium]|nr:MAG: hypothetical protein EP349_06400 [Alphaproteobacteria bacterium]